MKKIYNVKVSFSVPVYTDREDKIKDILHREVLKEINIKEDDFDIETTSYGIPEEWNNENDLFAIPFGGDNYTVFDIMMQELNVYDWLNSEYVKQLQEM